jgi:hypothetical protein
MLEQHLPHYLHNLPSGLYIDAVQELTLLEEVLQSYCPHQYANQMMDFGNAV